MQCAEARPPKGGKQNIQDTAGQDPHDRSSEEKHGRIGKNGGGGQHERGCTQLPHIVRRGAGGGNTDHTDGGKPYFYEKEEHEIGKQSSGKGKEKARDAAEQNGRQQNANTGKDQRIRKPAEARAENDHAIRESRLDPGDGKERRKKKFKIGKGKRQAEKDPEPCKTGGRLLIRQ